MTRYYLKIISDIMRYFVCSYVTINFRCKDNWTIHQIGYSSNISKGKHSFFSIIIKQIYLKYGCVFGKITSFDFRCWPRMCSHLQTLVFILRHQRSFVRIFCELFMSDCGNKSLINLIHQNISPEQSSVFSRWLIPAIKNLRQVGM